MFFSGQLVISCYVLSAYYIRLVCFWFSAKAEFYLVMLVITDQYGVGYVSSTVVACRAVFFFSLNNVKKYLEHLGV